MNTKQVLENYFLKNHYSMINTQNKEDKYYYAGVSLEICNILATLNDTNQDTELQRLYEKYNLNDDTK